MTKRRSLTRSGPGKHLLKTLTDSPALPTLVQRLPPPTLKRLIDHVGVHDAGALILLTTTEQLREVFEESLWHNLTPGTAEQLQTGRFLEWLNVILEASPTFAAERLTELGETFLVLNLSPLITVTARDTDLLIAPEEATEEFERFVEGLMGDRATEEFGGYLVSATDEDAWDSVRTLLAELEGEDSGFLERVLERCCYRPSVLGFVDDGQSLRADERHAREQSREQKGFVTAHLAGSFLRTAGNTGLSELIEEDDYDDLSQQYFARLAAATKQAPTPASEITARSSQVDARAEAFELHHLEKALEEAEIVSATSPRLLQGPSGTQEAMTELQMHLDRLQVRQPALFSARLAELVFLANVLMAGSWYRGGRFNEAQAAQAALACANLGLDYVSRQSQSASQDELVDSALTRRPGIVRLFRVGWQLLQSIPLRAANDLLEALRSDEVRSLLAHKSWMLAEVELAVTQPDLIDLVQRGEFEDVADNLLLLSLVFDQRACTALAILIADWPRYPQQLNIGFRPGPPVTGSRYLSTMRELDRVHAFLRDLPVLIRV
jgi:hypothetical protein